ncbi:MAG: FAD-dependent oxidoreductase, partial [Marinobacter sp.]
MAAPITSDVLVAGGGLAGIVTALEALRAGKSVTLVDRDSPERFGGLALWAFGGMALIDRDKNAISGIEKAILKAGFELTP